MIHPNPRMREEMKNGHCMAAARMPPPGILVRTTTMAMGTASRSERAVVNRANSAVFNTTFPNPASVNSFP
jgi:hypothetical protein